VRDVRREQGERNASPSVVAMTSASWLSTEPGGAIACSMPCPTPALRGRRFHPGPQPQGIFPAAVVNWTRLPSLRAGARQRHRNGSLFPQGQERQEAPWRRVRQGRRDDLSRIGTRGGSIDGNCGARRRQAISGGFAGCHGPLRQTKGDPQSGGAIPTMPHPPARGRG
jgi:hypothetical protein